MCGQVLNTQRWGSDATRTTCAACAALVGLRAAALTAGVEVVYAEAATVAVWLLATLLVDRNCRKRAVGIALFASALIVGMPLGFIVVAALAHNSVAIVAWLVVAKPARRDARLLVGALVGFALIAMLVGPGVAAATGGDRSRWLTIDGAAATLFPDVPDGIGRALIVAFTFLQGVHYAIWLDWIPASQWASRRGVPQLALGVATLVVASLGCFG